MYIKSKRVFDVIISTIFMVLLMPLFLLTAIAVKATSRGPAIYVHRRVGYMGKEIKVYKFRSMIQGADELEQTLNDEELEEYKIEYKLLNDPRITRVGRFLRHTSLDELPQFVNVLMGDMSIIGPRPVIKEELSNYSEEEEKILLSVKPGISGYWQVYGRGRTGYEDGSRQKQELFYANNASMKLDSQLFFMTFITVLRGRGAR